jgi:DNA-directed RNA polymerase subunit M/transcription elongation factor TFIIS
MASRESDVIAQVATAAIVNCISSEHLRRTIAGEPPLIICGESAVERGITSKSQIETWTAIAERIELGIRSEADSWATPLGIHSTDPQYRSLYSSHLYKITANIRHVFEVSDVPLEKIAQMTSEELNPDAHADVRKIIQTRSGVTLARKVSTLYRCAKCGESRTVRVNTMERCVDEDTTITWLCLVCGHKWSK